MNEVHTIVKSFIWRRILQEIPTAVSNHDTVQSNAVWRRQCSTIAFLSISTNLAAYYPHCFKFQRLDISIWGIRNFSFLQSTPWTQIPETPKESQARPVRLFLTCGTSHCPVLPYLNQRKTPVCSTRILFNACK